MKSTYKHQRTTRQASCRILLPGWLLLLSVATVAQAAPTSRPTCAHVQVRLQTAHQAWRKSAKHASTQPPRLSHKSDIARCLRQGSAPQRARIAGLVSAWKKASLFAVPALAAMLWQGKIEQRAARESLLRMCGPSYSQLLALFRLANSGFYQHKRPFKRFMTSQSPLYQHPCTLPSLLGATHDRSTSVRFLAVEIMKRIGASAIPFLAKRLQQSGPIERADVVWISLQWKQARSQLQALLRHQLSTQHQDLLTRTLQALTQDGIDHKQPIPHLWRRKLWSHQAMLIRKYSIDLLCKRKAPIKRLRLILKHHLADPSPYVRESVFRCLGSYGKAASFAIPHLLKRRHHTAELKEAITAMAWIAPHDPRVLQLLYAHKDTSDKALLVSVLRAMSRHHKKAPKITAFLRKTLTHKSDEIRKEAALALGARRAPRRQIIDALRTQYPRKTFHQCGSYLQARVGIIQALARLKAAEGLQLISHILQHRNASCLGLVSAAIEALPSFGHKARRHTAPLLAMLPGQSLVDVNTVVAPDQTTNSVIETALLRIAPHTTLRQQLLPSLKHTEEVARIRAIKLLTALKLPTHLQASTRALLIAHVANEKSRVARASILYALWRLQMPPSQLAAWLTTPLQDKDPMLRYHAIQILKQLGTHANQARAQLQTLATKDPLKVIQKSAKALLHALKATP